MDVVCALVRVDALQIHHVPHDCYEEGRARGRRGARVSTARGAKAASAEAFLAVALPPHVRTVVLVADAISAEHIAANSMP